MIDFCESTLYSREYQDIYFHPEKGIEESSHVFLDGVELKCSLAGRKEATLAELGFGAGLNFLLTAKLLESMAYTGLFNYLSIEAYPLPKEILLQLYSQEVFRPIKKYSQKFLALYPSFAGAGQTLKFVYTPNLHLTLLLYPVEEALAHLPTGIDYWYLDGFNPKTNPQMWDKEVGLALSSKSNKGAKLATFSACRLVKNTLESANFCWQRVRGFNKKRHSLKAYKL